MIAFLLFLLSSFPFVFLPFPPRDLGTNQKLQKNTSPVLCPILSAQACLRQSATKMQQREMPCFMGFLAFFMLTECVFEGFPPNSCRPHPDIEQSDVFFFFCPVSGAFQYLQKHLGTVLPWNPFSPSNPGNPGGPGDPGTQGHCVHRRPGSPAMRTHLRHSKPHSQTHTKSSERTEIFQPHDYLLHLIFFMQ